LKERSPSVSGSDISNQSSPLPRLRLVKDFAPDKKHKQLSCDMAVVDPTAGGNPVKLTKAGAMAILVAAMRG
jgi:hypothetical protein